VELSEECEPSALLQDDLLLMECYSKEVGRYLFGLEDEDELSEEAGGFDEGDGGHEDKNGGDEGDISTAATEFSLTSSYPLEGEDFWGTSSSSLYGYHPFYPHMRTIPFASEGVIYPDMFGAMPADFDCTAPFGMPYGWPEFSFEASSASAEESSVPQGTRTKTSGHAPKQQYQRTKLCSFFLQGKCNRKNCNFAHGEGDLQQLPNYAKTRLCGDFTKTGHCSQGESCRFAHGKEDMAKGPKAQRRAVRKTKTSSP